MQQHAFWEDIPSMLWFEKTIHTPFEKLKLILSFQNERMFVEHLHETLKHVGVVMMHDIVDLLITACNVYNPSVIGMLSSYLHGVEGVQIEDELAEVLDHQISIVVKDQYSPRQASSLNCLNVLYKHLLLRQNFASHASSVVTSPLHQKILNVVAGDVLLETIQTIISTTTNP